MTREREIELLVEILTTKIYGWADLISNTDTQVIERARKIVEILEEIDSLNTNN